MKKNWMLIVLFVMTICVLVGCGQTEEVVAEDVAVAEVLTWQDQYDLGMKYLSEGNYEEAIIAFTAAIELEPKKADAYLGLAEVYIAQNDFDAAIAILEDAMGVVDDSSALQARLDELNSGNVSDFWGNVRKMSCYDEAGALQSYFIYGFEDGKQNMVTSYDADGNYLGQLELTYDEMGKLLESYWYDTQGGVGRISYEYDADGNQIKETVYTKTGEVNQYSISQYEGSAEVQKIQYRPDGEKEVTYAYTNYENGNKRVDENWHITGTQRYQLWEYNEAGEIEKYGAYQSDGTPDWYDIYEYDEAGNCTDIISYDGDGTVIGTTTYN